ncbi:histidine kinase [Streptomyces sp. NBC_01020]|uniref:sensor histidine kinase n=1 Tax=unclassified Streptomyces TaxID=2593676 RepID=UPI002E221EF4|nr:histidine kinase [Streptomyces sp. NBC_01020]WSX71202.1 histidine kinase [Streptomyces sp. NBC_00932]
MFRLIRPLLRPVTYTRWLHACVPLAFVAVWLFIDIKDFYLPVFLVIPLGLIPGVRLEEALQAQLLLTPDERGRPEASISVAPSLTWADRWRTVLWLEARLASSVLGAIAPVQLLFLARRLFDAAPWWSSVLAPLPIVAIPVCVVASGTLTTIVARLLLGPSQGQRLTALEERTEQLLERNRIARELHDSIGHALTVAVVQAGAARAANDPAFTDRALAAIEETGREALEDLERVLLILRESATPLGQRPSLSEADRLLESARSSGAKVDAEVSGPVELVPGPISREGYRMLQEALTNVLRHSGPVPVRVRISVVAGQLSLEVTNPLNGSTGRSSGGSGLRGIRERAALLGGTAETGPHRGDWRVYARLPLDGLG